MTDLSSADAKIHILYIVGNVPGISYHMLMDKCLSSLYMEFFTFSKACRTAQSFSRLGLSVQGM